MLMTDNLASAGRELPALPMMVTGGDRHFFCLFFGLHWTVQMTNETSIALNEISLVVNETSNGFNKTHSVANGVR
jgi:hypothetical protein